MPMLIVLASDERTVWKQPASQVPVSFELFFSSIVFGCQFGWIGHSIQHIFFGIATPDAHKLDFRVMYG